MYNIIMLKPLFHFSVAVLNSYVLWYDQRYVELPLPANAMSELPFRARCIFLTMWCLLLQTIYYSIAFLSDIIEEDSPKKRQFLHRITDAYFSVAFPLALYVSTAFWCVYLTDREMIFPEQFDHIYPPLFNHFMHTTVSLFMFIELFISYREYPKRFNGILTVTSIVSLYTVWFFYLYDKYDAWVYILFGHLNWTSRIIFVTFSLLSAPVLYIIGEKLNQFVVSRLYSTDGKLSTHRKSKRS